MDRQNMIGGVLNQLSGSAAAPAQDPYAQYEQISSIVPSNMMGSMIGTVAVGLVVRHFMEKHS